MRVKQKKIDETTVQLNATASADEVTKAFDTVEQGLASRLGLVPDPTKTAARAIEEKLRIEDADAALASQAAQELVPYAIDEKGLIPANLPVPESDMKIERGKPYSFRIKVKTKDNLELSSYDPVEIKVPRFKFDESVVDEQLAQLPQRYPEFVTDDPHPVREGDVCSIALKASKDGERIEGLSTGRRTLSLGKGFMPDDFERQIIGMEPGQTRKFTFEAPSWDGDGEATETFEATVTVLEMQKEVTPELDDAWLAVHMPMYKSVDDLRRTLRADLSKQARHQYDLQVASVAQVELGERFKGHIEDEAYESTAANIKNTLVTQLQQQGTTLDKFIEEQGGEQAFNMGLMMQARQTLLCDYALDALFQHEQIELTDDDVRDACADINPQNPMAVRQHMEQNGRGFALREIAQRHAASRWLVAHAKIEYIDDPDQL